MLWWISPIFIKCIRKSYYAGGTAHHNQIFSYLRIFLYHKGKLYVLYIFDITFLSSACFKKQIGHEFSGSFFIGSNFFYLESWIICIVEIFFNIIIIICVDFFSLVHILFSFAHPHLRHVLPNAGYDSFFVGCSFSTVATFEFLLLILCWSLCIRLCLALMFLLKWFSSLLHIVDLLFSASTHHFQLTWRSFTYLQRFDCILEVIFWFLATLTSAQPRTSLSRIINFHLPWRWIYTA